MDGSNYMLAFCIILIAAEITNAMMKERPKQPVLIISFDGMGWESIDSNLTHTPNFDFIAKSGVKAKNLMAVHPVKTFPVHTTFVTGLYPESHGVVDSKFWDPKYLSKFIMEHDCSNFDPKFYNESEPIWLTMEKRGRRTGVHYWPGSTSFKRKPSFYAQEFCNVDCGRYKGPMMMEYLRLYFQVHCFFNWAKSYQKRIDTIVDDWLMSEDPPEFVLLYIEEPDLIGHKNGPNSKEYLKQIEALDKDVLGYLLGRLKDRKLIDNANIVIVSDHGIVETKHTRQVRLHDYIKPDSYFNNIAAREHIWPKPGLFQEVYDKLQAAKNPHFKVFKKEDIPEHLHFQNHRRIPPIYLIAQEGWILRPEWNALAEGKWTEGAHGWPPTENSAGIFYARGPAFKRGYSSPRSAHAIDIYSLLCYLLDEKPLPNNGSLLNMVEFLRGNETHNYSKLWPYEVSIRNKIKNKPKHKKIIRPERPNSSARDRHLSTTKMSRDGREKHSTVTHVLATITTLSVNEGLAVLPHLTHKASITNTFNQHQSKSLTITNHEQTSNSLNENAFEERSLPHSSINHKALRSEKMAETIASVLPSQFIEKTGITTARAPTPSTSITRYKDFFVTSESPKITTAATAAATTTTSAAVIYKQERVTKLKRYFLTIRTTKTSSSEDITLTTTKTAKALKITGPTTETISLTTEIETTKTTTTATTLAQLLKPTKTATIISNTIITETPIKTLRSDNNLKLSKNIITLTPTLSLMSQSIELQNTLRHQLDKKNKKTQKPIQASKHSTVTEKRLQLKNNVAMATERLMIVPSSGVEENITLTSLSPNEKQKKLVTQTVMTSTPHQHLRNVETLTTITTTTKHPFDNNVFDNGVILRRAKYSKTPTLVHKGHPTMPFSTMKHSFNENTSTMSYSALTPITKTALRNTLTEAPTTKEYSTVDATVKPTPTNSTAQSKTDTNSTDIFRVLALSSNRTRSGFEEEEPDWFKDCPPYKEPEWENTNDQHNSRPMNKAAIGSLSYSKAVLVAFIALRILVMDFK